MSQIGPALVSIRVTSRMSLVVVDLVLLLQLLCCAVWACVFPIGLASSEL